jgi:uncharacterized repeat protein (TIGR01451 family)
VRRAMQVYLPTATVAVLAVVLQLVALLASPGAPTTGRSLRLAGIDFGAPLTLAIPRLDPLFLFHRLGSSFAQPLQSPPSSRRPGRSGAGGSRRTLSDGAPSPTPASTPAPTDSGLIKGAGNLELSMTVDRRSAAPGDMVTYEIYASNTGDRAVTTDFITDTHTPRFTLSCTSSGQPVCTIPGDYDGSSTDSHDAHTYPAKSQRTATVAAHQRVIIRTIRVQVLEGAPSGAKLYNHTHVQILGSGRTSTHLAPIVIVT